MAITPFEKLKPISLGSLTFSDYGDFQFTDDTDMVRVLSRTVDLAAGRVLDVHGQFDAPTVPGTWRCGYIINGADTAEANSAWYLLLQRVGQQLTLTADSPSYTGWTCKARLTAVQSQFRPPFTRKVIPTTLLFRLVTSWTPPSGFVVPTP